MDRQPTNNFKTGGKDEYHLLKEVPLRSQQAIIDLKNFPSTFYKDSARRRKQFSQPLDNNGNKAN